jgi:hypothetical protein
LSASSCKPWLVKLAAKISRLLIVSG